MAVAAVIEPDGSIVEQPDDWSYNALHDAGEQSMLEVYLTATANPTKYLGLLNDASIAETDGTMTAVTESKTAGTDGYNRQQITNDTNATTGWPTSALVAGDWRMSAAEKTFGPITGTALTGTHTSLSTTLTGAGLLLATLALAATTTVAVGQSFKVVPRWTQQ